MYKSLAMFNGGIIAVMIFSNGIMTEHLGNIPAVLLNHIIGLASALLLFYVTKTKWHSLKGIPLFYLTAGVTGLITVSFTNIAFLSLGATVTLMLSMFGRLASSAVIDHFGLMGMKPCPFHPAKVLGLLLMVLGIAFIVFV